MWSLTSHLTFQMLSRYAHLIFLNNVCVLGGGVGVVVQSPSNQRFYREITGYRMSVGDHRVAQ